MNTYDLASFLVKRVIQPWTFKFPKYFWNGKKTGWNGLRYPRPPSSDKIIVPVKVVSQFRPAKIFGGGGGGGARSTVPESTSQLLYR